MDAGNAKDKATVSQSLGSLGMRFLASSSKDW